MFELHCEDLVLNLCRKTGVLRESILKKMSNDHQVNIVISCSSMLKSSLNFLSNSNFDEFLDPIYKGVSLTQNKQDRFIICFKTSGTVLFFFHWLKREPKRQFLNKC